jgi:hypothetical protein
MALHAARGDRVRHEKFDWVKQPPASIRGPGPRAAEHQRSAPQGGKRRSAFAAIQQHRVRSPIGRGRIASQTISRSHGGSIAKSRSLLLEQQNNEDAAEFASVRCMLSGRRVMPFVAEFTTDGGSKMLDSGHASNEDKDAIQNFEKQAMAMAEARRCPVHLQILHNGQVVHSKSYGNADNREI